MSDPADQWQHDNVPHMVPADPKPHWIADLVLVAFAVSAVIAAICWLAQQ